MNIILTVSNNESFAEQFAGLVKSASTASLLVQGCTYKQVDEKATLLPVLIVVDLVETVEVNSSFLLKLSNQFPNCPIIGAGHPQDVQQLLEFVKMGVKDFLNVPLRLNEVSNLLSKIKLRSVEAPTKASGKIVAIYSPKGGVGVTFLAANLAVALAKENSSRVAICDLSLECGDVSTYLNLTPKYTIRDVIDNDQLLDISFLEGAMLTHESGVRILAAPREHQNPPTSDNINALKSIFALLRQNFDFILIDAGHMDPGLLQFVLAESDTIFLMGNPDVASLKGLISLVKKMKTLHYSSQKIQVIMNRYNSKNQVDANEFEKITNHPVACLLPNNYALCIQAVNTGDPISKINDKADLSKKIAELAQMMVRSSGISIQANQTKSSSPKSMLEMAKKGILRCF